METILEGKYFKVIQNAYGFIIVRCDKDFEYIVSTVQIDDCFFSTPVLTLKDVEFNTVDVFDVNLPMEDVWEMLQEYITCVKFAKKTLEDLYRDESLF